MTSEDTGESDSSGEERESRKKSKLSGTRQIELRWLYSTNGDRFVHDRTKQGGGTRKVSLPKSAKNSNIML